jgi:DNA-binding NarL/FixJ family response regulator
VNRPRVLLGDDHALILGGVRATLAPRFDVVGEATDGKALVAEAERLRPDIVVLDISMPLLNGFEAARQLRQILPSAGLIFLSQHLSPAYLRQALEIGVAGYVLKSETTDELEPAINRVLKGETYASPRFGDDTLSGLRGRDGGLNRKKSELSERQRQILQLLIDGRSNKEVSSLMNLSIKTIEFHRAQIMSKLGAHSAAELARLAIQQGIVPG